MDGRAARVLACALVILVHTNQYTRPTAESWWPFGWWGLPLYGLAVPTFLVLSGYVARPGTTLPRARRLLPPFVVGTLALLPTLDVSPPLYAAWTVLVGAWQLYYLPLLLQLLAFTPWLDRLSPRVMLAVGLGSTIAAYTAVDLAAIRDGGIIEAELRRLFLPWLGFYVLGRWSRGRDLQLWPLTLVALLGLVAHGAEMRAQILGTGFDDREQFMIGGLPLQLAGPLVLILASDRWSSRRFFAWAAPLTLPVYIVHTPVLVAVYGLCRRLGWTSAQPYEVPLVALPVAVISFGLAALASRHRWTAWALGLPAPHPPPQAERQEARGL